MIWNILAFSAIRYLFRLGLAPKGSVIRQALIALKKDDLGSALDSYFMLAKADFSNERVQVLREIIISEIKYRKKVLHERMEQLKDNTTNGALENDREFQSCREALSILDGYLGRLGIRMDSIGIAPGKEDPKSDSP